MGKINTDRDAAWHAKLRRLWNQTNPKLSTSEIARIFDISKNALVGAAHRANLTPRPSPIVRKVDPLPARPLLRRLSAAALQTIVVVKQAVPPPRLVPTAPVRGRTIPCTWVMTMGPPARYCEEPSHQGKSFCPGHCAIVYIDFKDERLMAAE